jgi:Transmembrane secretion effector
VVIASIGSWGQTVGAQRLFVNDPNAATIVPLVQTATTQPMMLLALGAGVLADTFDRRWMMFVIEVYFITVAASMSSMTAPATSSMGTAGADPMLVLEVDGLDPPQPDRGNLQAGTKDAPLDDQSLLS